MTLYMRRSCDENFDVVSGSSLTWTGDIYNPSLDVKVQYQVRASAEPLGVEQAITQLFTVQLNITGTLEKNRHFY